MAHEVETCHLPVSVVSLGVYPRKGVEHRDVNSAVTLEWMPLTLWTSLGYAEESPADHDKTTFQVAAEPDGCHDPENEVTNYVQLRQGRNKAIHMKLFVRVSGRNSGVSFRASKPQNSTQVVLSYQNSTSRR